MGYHLWIDGELAWAQVTYEYRPLGTAVISASGLFKRRANYLGQFASLGNLNTQLAALPRAPRCRP